MAERYWKKLALLAKLEDTYGTDATPTGVANAMLGTDVSFTPLAGGEASRDLLLPYMGQQGVMLTGEYGQIEFSIEVAGSGTAGDAPAYGSLLRACGMAETVSEGEDVVYNPVSATFESVSLYYNRDGVRHILLGCRGNFTVSLVPSQIPRFRFTMMGLLGTIADSALPTVDHTGFIKPVPVSKAKTTAALHGFTGAFESLSFDMGQAVSPRMLINDEKIALSDRAASGTAVVAADTLATKDWFSIIRERTRGALEAVHGTAAGNIVEFDAPSVEIGRPTEGQTDNVLNYSLPLMLCPSTGNDELTITVK